MIKVYNPSPGLSDLVSCYWALSDLPDPVTELVYPTGKIQIIFHYGKSFVDTASNGNIITHPRYAVCGQKTTYSNVLAEKDSGMIGAVLKTEKVFRLLGIPLYELTDLTVGLCDILHEWQSFRGEFEDCTNDESRIAILEKFLLKKRPAPPDIYDYFIKSCINEIQLNRGLSLPYTSLEKFTLSERSMQRIIRERTGLTPKKYADIVRFENTVNILGKTPDLTEAAHQAGFYDQSHFIKEFKKFTGLPPSRFLKAV